ncbi:hypothetical protein [Streptomyces sp. NPDC007205]|uniref:hypothetical protein n=1 Tax=Streptomyces sp. NPDC007205 TaxID=3154316 RepID=UPI0033CA95B8
MIEQPTGSASPLTYVSEAARSGLPRDLVAARDDLTRVQEQLKDIMAGLAVGDVRGDTREERESARRVSHLRKRQADLVSKVIGHGFWIELDPADVLTMWNTLHHRPQQDATSTTS